MRNMEREVIELQQAQKYDKERLDRLEADFAAMVKERKDCNEAHGKSMSDMTKILGEVVSSQKTNSEAIRDINRVLKWAVLLVLSGVVAAVFKVIFK